MPSRWASVALTDLHARTNPFGKEICRRFAERVGMRASRRPRLALPGIFHVRSHHFEIDDLAHASRDPGLRRGRVGARLRAALDARSVPHASVGGARLGPRCLFPRPGIADVAVGRGAADRRRHCRSLRRRARARRRCTAPFRRPLADGLRWQFATPVLCQRRCSRRLWPVRGRLPSRARRFRQANAGGMAFTRLRRRHCCGLLRPVPVCAARHCLACASSTGRWRCSASRCS